MNANKPMLRLTMIVGLLTAAIFVGAPSLARADQGKWWNPKQRGQVVRVRESYRAPAWHSARYARPVPRYYRPWNGYRVYRDRAWFGPGRYRSRPVYGWRYYAAPVYYYPRRIVYVHPIRFFVSADAVIGGVGIHASYADPCPVYGCNFCDARFTSFHAYEVHVAHCPDAPRGYQVCPEDWQSASFSHGPQDRDDWQSDDED